jgi:aminomethyltransferase
VESYEIWLSRDWYTQVWDALIASGGRAVGAAAVELLRIACGIPLYGVDIRERDLPQETEQQRALHFSKGCYVGQEIVERIRSRGNVHRKFSGFDVRGPLPAPGTKLQSEGKDVGEVTSAAVLPAADGDHPVALGYIRREIALPGKELQAGDARLLVVTLPFALYLGPQIAKDETHG